MKAVVMIRKALAEIRWRLWGRRLLQRRWAAAIAAEVVVPGPDGARWAVFQYDGSIRYVAANLFARHYDQAVPIEMITHCDTAVGCAPQPRGKLATRSE